MDGHDSALPQRVIDSRSGFIAAVHEALDRALAQRARRMLWADSDFAEWPLDDPALLQRLTDWLRLPQRQLVLLASDYELLRRRHARFVACYRMWSHVIAAFAPAEDDVAQLPCLLLADRTVLVQLLDKDHWRGWSSAEPASLRLAREQTEALLQRSESAFAVTTLGL
jgi:hypothetical protein